MESYQKKLDVIGEKEASFRIEMFIDYLKNDYNMDQGLIFDSRKLGF